MTITRTSGRRRRMLVAIATATAVLAGGCGLGGEKPSARGTGNQARPGSITPIDSLKDVPVKVGSKDFTEQLILGQMSIAILEAAGAKPVDKTKIAGSTNSRDALVTGATDVYWEYVGTAWDVYLQREEKVENGRQMFDRVAELDKAKVEWLPMSPLVDTYGIALSQRNAQRLKITKLSELRTLPQNELTFCVGTEFYGRPKDGLAPMLKTYGLDLAKIPAGNVHKMADGLVYAEADKGDQCVFASTFSSDGRISAKKLKVLEDDRQFWPGYNAAVNINRKTFDKYPDLAKVFQPVSDKLTTEIMQDLNAQVDVQGKKPRAVARDWLRKEGFIK